MTNLGNVSFNRPRRQQIGIGSSRLPFEEFRFPGEPEEGTSEQMQSWIDAGGDVKNWWTSLQEATSGLNAGARTQGQIRPPTSNPMESFKYGNEFQDPFEVFKYGQPGADNSYLPGVDGSTPSARPGQGFMDYVRASPIAGLANIFPPNLLKDSFNNMLAGASSAFRSGPPPGAGADLSYLPGVDSSTGMQDTGTATPSRTIEELMALAAQYAPQPDYSQYRASLEDMVLNPETGLSPRIQAMYNQLAERAGENQQRVADIYGGATGNVGAAYDTSAANISDAFTSSQQNLVDSMARLGIEEAAGQVLPQGAQRQASALAALEQSRAGGLSALERYGASSGDFASQMEQVSQQRGLEQNELLLGALQRQLADSFGMEAQQRAQYNPMQGALDYLQLEQSINPQADPRASQADAEFLYQQEQDDTNVFRQYYQDYYSQTLDQAAARELARADAIAGIMGPRIQQRAMSDPNFVPMASQ